MDEEADKGGKCLLHNWAEERAVAALDSGKTRKQIQRLGHRGILTLDQDTKMESVTTLKAAYVAPQSQGVRTRGIRRELLEKQFAQMIRPFFLDRVGTNRMFWNRLQPDDSHLHYFPTMSQSDDIEAARNPPTPKTDYSSTTQRDFTGQGFVPLTPETTEIHGHDYKTDQAVTFWSENYRQIQGVTAARNVKDPFRKSALFSTPISERLDASELPSDS